MCTVSMIAGDWQQRHPQFVPQPTYPGGLTAPGNGFNNPFEVYQGPSRFEFDALKAELEELKKLLLAAKEYDTKTGQKDCEDPDKVAVFKALAKLVGVDMKAVFE